MKYWERDEGVLSDPGEETHLIKIESQNESHKIFWGSSEVFFPSTH